MADLNIPIDVAQILALFMETLFYGLYLVSFGVCMYTMFIVGRSTTRQRVFNFAIAILLFTFATLDVALLLRHVLDAFIWYHGPGGATEELGDISYWVSAMKTVAYVAQTSIGDAVLIYRCYIVYGRNWKAAFPLCLLWAAGLVTEGFNCYIVFATHTNALLSTGELAPFIISMMSITLALNLIATSMIVYKIWSIKRYSRDFFGALGESGLRRAIRIVVESGLMYSLGVAVFFIVYVAGNNALYGVSDCVVQIIGISFNLIIIRVEQGRTVEAEYTLTSTRSGGPRTNRRPKLRLPRLVFNRTQAGGTDDPYGVGYDACSSVAQIRDLNTSRAMCDLPCAVNKEDEESNVARGPPFTTPCDITSTT
ncbi:hypothetical protein PHLGIDRAFT_129367 [Phlebiopsis gigantea 11061_1 CR5-6]|uniref:Uncharacterized protein n=1 Tax=Phlebiopsis gigantea (strain 11061_1 CR5-6) TaxID=745531 RepID=A0A0C3RUG5_PHLG1|nr:hypothetical protein PHLGIDRAFT_129367 [Phlebiopsis gigantea 11061_1 CR5-6]